MKAGFVAVFLVQVLACDSPSSSTLPICEPLSDASTTTFDAGTSATITVNTILLDRGGAIGEVVGDPLWVGFQAGNAGWQQVISTETGTFRFAMHTDPYNVAVVCGESGAQPWSEVNLVHTTVAETQNLSVLCAATLTGAAPTTFDVYIRGPSPPGDTKLWMGGRDSGFPWQVGAGTNVGFQFPTVTRSADLVVGASPYVAGAYQPWEFLLLREFSSVLGGFFFVDFNLKPWVKSEARSASVEGFDLQTGDEHVESDFITAQGTWIDLTRWTYFPGLTDVANGIPFFALRAAETQPGDIHRITAMRTSGSSRRIAQRYSRDLSQNEVVRLPPGLAPVAVSTTPVPSDCLAPPVAGLPMVSWAPEIDVQFHRWFHAFDDQRVANTVISAGWLGDRSSYVMANPSGASGWDPRWMPIGQAAQSWQFAAVRSNITLAEAVHAMDAGALRTRLPPLDGAEIFLES